MSDLISREALKKEVEKLYEQILRFHRFQLLRAIIDIIDNAPTVEPCENCDLYFKAMTKEEMRKGGAEE